LPQFEEANQWSDDKRPLVQSPGCLLPLSGKKTTDYVGGCQRQMHISILLPRISTKQYSPVIVIRFKAWLLRIFITDKLFTGFARSAL